MKETTAVYPGTFDPMTLGHLDLIKRSASLFDQLIVAVAGVSAKPSRLFGIEDRIAMVKECLAAEGITNARVMPLGCLLVDFCRENGVRAVVRGLRAYSDFEYEFQMALTNRQLNATVETLFMMPNEEHSYITASSVREVARYGGRTDHFVPANVEKRLRDYLAEHPEQRIQGERLETPARLIVDLGRLDGGKTAHLQGALAREALELEDLEQLSPAGDLAYDLHGELMPGDEFLVRGVLALPCSCTCGRCGGTFQKTYAEPSFCETYPVSGMESLDLTESVREGIMLALPTYPVCRETCKGVCLHCGKNLNTGACTCGVEGETPFGEALQGFAPEQDA